MWLAFFSMMWSIYVLPKLLAKWPAFFGERPQLPGPHCGDVRWSTAGTAVLGLVTARLEKRAFLAAKGEGRGYQWTELNRGSWDYLHSLLACLKSVIFCLLKS